MPKLSVRGENMPASPIRKLVPFSDEARSRGVHVHHLNIGQPDIETPRPILDAYRRFDAKVLAYGPSQGLAELREGVARYYDRIGHPLKPQHVHVTTGGSEALMFAFAAVTDPGDEIIVFEPFYANYNAFAVQLGAKLRPITSHSSNGFHLPPDEEIEAEIGPRTKAIVFGSPGNPTGTVYTKDELLRLGRIAERHDLYLISDEVYREFVYDGATAPSALSIPGSQERVIVIDSVSKRFSACGARIGFTITKSDALNSVFTRLSFSRLCPATVDQYGAIAAYELSPDYFEPIVAEYQRRRDVLVKGLRAIPGVGAYMPEGAFYTVIDLPVDDADRFCEWLLKDFHHDGETVMMAPASGFYSRPELGKREARIAYVLNVPALERSLTALEHALKRYPGATR